MVKLAGSGTDRLSSSVVRRLLWNKFVVIIGDSIQRAIYKDLVSLLQREQMLSEKDLRLKGERIFLGDELVEGGTKGQLNNGTSYTEVRQYSTDTHLVRFYFVTRCYNQYVESILTDLTAGPPPDLVIMNSCLWDMTRYGMTAITQYKENMVLLFKRLKTVLPADCMMIWNSTLPISKNARGGFLVQEINYKSHMLRIDVLESNYYARQIVVQHGFDLLDLHFWFRNRVEWRAGDGIHWCAQAHRHISEILFSHVASAWGFAFPPISVPPHRVRPPVSSDTHEDLLPTQHFGAPCVKVNLNQQERALRKNLACYQRPAPYPSLALSQRQMNYYNNLLQTAVDYNANHGSSHLWQDNEYHQQDEGYHQQDEGYHQQDEGYHQQDEGYHQQDKGYHQQDKGYHQQNDGYHQQDNHFQFGNSASSMMQVSVLDDFSSGWTGYSNDNYQPIHRRPNRGSRPRHHHY